MHKKRAEAASADIICREPILKLGQAGVPGAEPALANPLRKGTPISINPLATARTVHRPAQKMP